MDSPKGHLRSLSESFLCRVVHRGRSCRCTWEPCFLWKIHGCIKYFFVARNGRITICNSPHGRIKHKLHNSNKVKTTKFKTTVEANFLLIDNSCEEQLRSYASKIPISTRFCCIISGQDLLPVVLNELEGQVQEQQTVEIQQLKTKTPHQMSYAGTFTSCFKELCSILTVWTLMQIGRKGWVGTVSTYSF